MGKTYETKNRILEMLENSNHTLTQLSRMLSLSPSTVSQHLRELQYSGSVRMVHNLHFRKLKYYAMVKPEDAFNANTESPIAYTYPKMNTRARPRVW